MKNVPEALIKLLKKLLLILFDVICLMIHGTNYFYKSSVNRTHIS